MPITINGSGTITGASTLATTVASPAFTTPNIDSAQFATVSGTAPLYAARAWVNFNGTGTVAIRASGNVSSITDGGVGTYTVNFTTAMPNTDFCVQLSSEIGGGNGGFNGVTGTVTTSAVTFVAYTQAGTVRDISLAYVSIFR